MDNSYAAFCLDEAVIYFGQSLENALEKVAEGAKTDKVAEGRRKLELEKWLVPAEVREKQGMAGSGFANPVATK